MDEGMRRDVNRPVYHFDKNPAYRIVFSVVDFKDRRYIDIRNFALSPGGEYLATKDPGGVHVAAEQFEELVEGVSKLAEALSGDGPKGDS
jgi:hypothetical protein